jgi:hypothetical protein
MSTKEPGVVIHTCGLSYTGNINSRIEIKAAQGNKCKILSKKITKSKKGVVM